MLVGTMYHHSGTEEVVQMCFQEGKSGLVHQSRVPLACPALQTPVTASFSSAGPAIDGCG